MTLSQSRLKSLGRSLALASAADLLAAAPEASVVSLSSIHGARAYPRLLAYAASKGRIEMLTRTLAVNALVLDGGWSAR